MLKITLTADYALRAVVYIAANCDERCVPAAELARTQQIPTIYVSKVLQTLVRADIVATSPGRRGGAKLSRCPSKISVLEVVEAVDGPIAVNHCLNGKGRCSRTAMCEMYPFWIKTRDELVKTLEQARISEFIGSASRNSSG